MRRRILSIQGGGVYGIFAARLLALMESELETAGLNPRAGCYFDLVTGTSTGGLIALAIGLGIPASNIVDLYLTKSRRIFPWRRRFFPAKAVRYLLGIPWYSNSTLAGELRQVFGERSLGEAKTRVVIPTYRYRQGVRLFKTAHHPTFSSDFRLPAWDIAAATAAAPVYFPPHTMQNGGKYIDGGVWANNPAQVAIAECIHYCGWHRSSLDVLSIRGVQDIVHGQHWSRVHGLPGALISAQVRGSTALAKTLVGDVGDPDEDHGHIEDFSETMPSGVFGLDKASSVNEVAAFADDLFLRRKNDIRKMFFSAVSESFDPFHKL